MRSTTEALKSKCKVMAMFVILKGKTYNHLQSEISRLDYALSTEKKKNETIISGCKKQLAEKDRLIKELTEAVGKFKATTSK